MKKKSLLLSVCLFGVVLSFALQWPVKGASRLLPFQGRLTDAQGKSVSDGERVVQFKLYNAPVGGQAVWSGEVQKLTVNGGLVSTLLGSKASLSGVDFNQDIYLELTMDANDDGQITLTDPPLLPRQSILPSIFAVESANSRLISGHAWSEVEELRDRVAKLERELLDTTKSLNDRLVALEAKTQALVPRDGHMIIAAGSYEFVFASDGNIGARQAGKPIFWDLYSNQRTIEGFQNRLDSHDGSIQSMQGKLSAWSSDGRQFYYSDREKMAWQGDGNVVIYRDDRAVWSTGTQH